MNTNYKQFSKLEIGEQNLKFFDESKVEIHAFTPQGQDREVRFFRRKEFDKWDKNGKIISRSGLTKFREPFEIEPWNQILIDEANVYGTKVDKDKEAYLKGQISSEEMMKETKMSMAKLTMAKLVWVGRSQMVCHPNSFIYGEIDEIWYDQETDTYYVGDTKTSSSVDKMSYWYQLGIYIAILKELNPGKNISPIGLIDWVKIKTEKWVMNREFNESEWAEDLNKSKNGWVATKEDRVYTARWNSKTPIQLEETNLLIQRNLEIEGILELAKKDIELLRKYNIHSVDEFEQLLFANREFHEENSLLQNEYNLIKDNLK